MSIIVIVLCGIVFGPLQVRSHGVHTQRLALGRALTGQSLVDGDQMAIAFAETGTVVNGGRTYGGPHLQRRAGMYFDEEGVLLAPRLVEDLLEDQFPAGVPLFLFQQPGTTWMLYGIATAWLLLIVWMRITVQFILTVLATAVPVLISLAAGSDRAMLAFAGMGLLTFTFVLLTQVVLLVLQLPHQALAVAHTVVKEATRNRLSLVFVVLLLVGLPLLPLELNADSPLRFRIQTFIARSLGYTYVMAACMTLFLSCASVAFEIRDRQIWQLMTKPLRRANYLLGKWIGVLSVNLVMLIVAGVSIFTYVKYLSGLPVAPGIEGMLDRLAVTDEVLTALDLSWGQAKDLIKYRASEFGQKEPLLDSVDDWDRQNHDLKEVVNEVAKILDDKNVPWMVRVGKRIGAERPTGQLAEFLGNDLINALWGQEPALE